MNRKIIINLILIILALIFMFGPLLVNYNANYEGTDNKAQQAISEIAPSYKPWVKNLTKPPSKEAESFLFAAQAGIGCLIIGYFIGYGRGKRAVQESARDKNA